MTAATAQLPRRRPWRPALLHEPIVVDAAPRGRTAGGRRTAGRQRLGRHVGPRARGAAGRRRTGDLRAGARRRDPRRRPAGLLRGLQRPAPALDRAGDPLRDGAGVPADAGRLPLGDDRGRLGAAQPAVDGGGVRRHGRGLPARLGRVARRRRRRRRHRVVDPAVRVRDPLRAVDGLPRVRGLADPRGPRPRALHPRTPSRTASRSRPASSPALR